MIGVNYLFLVQEMAEAVEVGSRGQSPVGQYSLMAPQAWSPAKRGRARALYSNGRPKYVSIQRAGR